jgi:DNA-directed RNA polymerase subunit alpha
MFHSIPT